MILSTDHGGTWSEWIPAHSGFPWSSPFGRVIEMADGRLLLPMWVSENESGPRVGRFRHQSYSGFAVSRDGGKHWGAFHKLGHFGETSLLLLRDNKTLLACLKQHPTRLTHVMRSDDDGRSWTEPRHFGVQGKNASMHLSPSGIPLILCSPVTPGPGEGTRPGYIYYSTDHGDTWRPGVRLEEPVGPVGTMAYAVSAVNLDHGKMLVVFYGVDPKKPETGDSPWSSTKTFIGANLVEEEI